MFIEIIFDILFYSILQFYLNSQALSQNTAACPTTFPIGSQGPLVIHYPHHLCLSNTPYFPIWPLFLDWLDPEDECTMLLRKISNYSPSYTMSHPKDFNVQQ